MSLFNLGGNNQTSKPAFSFSNTTTNNAAPLGFGASQPANKEQEQFKATSTAPQIDLEHLRNTTKWDHLQPALAEDIKKLDTSFFNQQIDCDAVGQLLRKIEAEAKGLEPALDYVTTKLDELESGLENDAENIVNFRDGESKSDEADGKCVFRTIDRMKIPRQYRTPGNETNGLGASMNSTGLSGWWNQPQTLRGTRSTSNMGGQSMQLVQDEDDGSGSGPKNIIDLFGGRADQFKQIDETQKQLLKEIEDFVEGLEDKVLIKERELNDQLVYGSSNAEQRKQDEKNRQLQQLRFVFGEVQRGLFEMADKVSTTRDGIVDLGLLR